jgi:hypothetical protein
MEENLENKSSIKSSIGDPDKILKENSSIKKNKSKDSKDSIIDENSKDTEIETVSKEIFLEDGDYIDIDIDIDF